MGIFSTLLKGIYRKPAAKNVLNDENQKAFPLRLGRRQGCSFLTLLFNTVLEVLAKEIRQGEKKVTQVTKKVNLALFSDNIILYVESPT